ncbi:MAG: hypothetical protein IJ932_06130 [Ruminococcus sp.]|nr:hypothetical protein [Ruminococcus sp.]
MNFLDLQLNTSLKNSLSSLDKGNRMPHALIISGDSKENREALCGHLAAWAVCSSDGDRPCGKCKNCKNAFDKAHSDIYFAKGSGKTKIYKAEEIREIIRDASIKPNQADRKVYIFEECDKKLSEISQNILLKTLEEPPQDILFILTCENAKNLLETIRSRAVTLNLGDEREVGGKPKELAEEILTSMLLSSEIELMKSTYMLNERFLTLETLDSIVIMLRDGLCAQSGFAPENNTDIAEKLCRKLTKAQFLELIDITNSAQLKINQNVSAELVGTWLCSQYRKTVW